MYHIFFQKKVKHVGDKNSFSFFIIYFASSIKLLHESSPYRQKKTGQQSEIRSQSPRENQY